jgi:5-(carboxyamino)imidazole ribonucleotide mutase
MEQNMEPLIGIIVGSKNDLKHVQECTEVLEGFGVPYEVVIASAHRSPVYLDKRMAELEGSVLVYIAIAGMAAHLPGVVASRTVKPVVGVPVSVSLQGLDALLSIVQMPSGIPVGAMAIDGAKNAAIYSIGIIAATEEGKKLKLGDKLTEMRAKRAAEIEHDNSPGMGRFNV